MKLLTGQSHYTIEKTAQVTQAWLDLRLSSIGGLYPMVELHIEDMCGRYEKNYVQTGVPIYFALDDNQKGIIVWPVPRNDFEATFRIVPARNTFQHIIASFRKLPSTKDI